MKTLKELVNPDDFKETFEFDIAKNNQRVIRVGNHEAQALVNTGNWKFTSKSVWKRRVRNVKNKG